MRLTDLAAGIVGPLNTGRDAAPRPAQVTREEMEMLIRRADFLFRAHDGIEEQAAIVRLLRPVFGRLVARLDAEHTP